MKNPFVWLLSVGGIFASAQSLPSAVLYHYGPREYLERDVSARTVPLADWRDGIMGGGGEFGLPAFRRGLYACPDLARGDNYAGPSDSWVIRIRVKDVCRKPGAFSAIDWRKPDASFSAWIKSAPGLPFRLAEYKRRCIQNDELSGYSEFGGPNPCAAVAQRYLQDSRVKIVYDSGVPGCWYIRDRNCIERIDGTPAEVLSFMLKWKPDEPCDPNLTGESWLAAGDHPENTWRVAISALARLDSFANPVLAKLEAHGRFYALRNHEPDAKAKGCRTIRTEAVASLGNLAGVIHQVCANAPSKAPALRKLLQDFVRTIDLEQEGLPPTDQLVTQIQSVCGGVPASVKLLDSSLPEPKTEAAH